jgi:peptidoglycan/LPS O-acetylase OafA/YrhL
MLWPLLAVVLGRKATRWLIPVLIVSAFLARLWLWPMLLATNWDGFALGALLAWMLGEPGPSCRRGPLRVGGLALLALATLTYPLWRGFVHVPLPAWLPVGAEKVSFSLNASRLFLCYFAIIGLVIIFSGHRLLWPLRNPGLCYLGTISYGLYLYHVFVYVIISASHYQVTCRDSMALDALKLAATVVVAVLSWECFESRLMHWKDRFPYPRSGAHRPHVLDPARRDPARLGA